MSSSPAEHTFLFADLAGYTALTEAHGDERAADVAAAFYAEARVLLPRYGATEVKALGDGLLLRIDDAAAGVRLGARLASDFGSRHRSLGVRVGLHTGTAVERDGDWFGTAVNLAARIADVADAGDVVLSSATADAALASSPALELQPTGRRQLRNVAEPIDLFTARLGEVTAHRLPVDPVCKMAIDPEHASERVVLRGVEHHFCSPQCAQAFERNPERYTRTSRRHDLLVSDRAREYTVERLARAYRRGRFDEEELETRIERTWSARTRADLSAVSRDLPRGRRHRRGPFTWLIRLITRPFRRLRRRRR